MTELPKITDLSPAKAETASERWLADRETFAEPTQLKAAMEVGFAIREYGLNYGKAVSAHS